jgi:phosphatidylinositol phospholipase C delta
VPVRDVCQAINKYAFVASPYPVVISLEIRCNVEQQDKLAAIIRESFGERLVTEPIDLDHIDTVPSPESLKGRIIIKTKPMPQHIAATPPSFSPPPSSPHLVPPIISASPPQTQDSTDSTTESDSSFVRLARRLSVSSGPNTKTPQGHSRALTDLPVYTSAVKYRGFSKLVKYDFNHMFSLSENTANRILKAGQGPDWVKHNFTHLTRIYPKGVRLTSSNYDPRPFWLSGAQLVALNYQTQDAGSMYNEALFHSSGYVLKPLGLRQKVVEETQAYRLRLHIISAQRLPPMDDLYVEATVGDEVLRTKATKGVSLTPRWDETLEYIVEARPSVVGMTFVHLEIRLSRGVVAQWTRPLSDTGRGYRYLPLADRDRQKYLFATLFARIDLEPLPAKTPSANANTPSKAVPQPIGYGAL